MHPWPPMDLVIRPRDDAEPALELRLASDDELLELIDVARQGVHAPGEMPFGRPWSEVDSPDFERDFLQSHWRRRAEISPLAWVLMFVVFADGAPVGVQSIDATGFATRRLISSGSWLALEWQGRGIGTRARACVLDLAFTHLGAVAAETGAWVDNPASHRIAEKLGYEPNGAGTWARRGEPTHARRFRMTAERWQQVRPFPTEVEDVDRCLPLLVGR